jgi:aspartate aminotransferase/aminotransferase
MGNRRFISDRVKALESSGIRRAFDLAATLPDPINFSIGQPDFPVPDAVKNAITQAVRENRNGYTPTRGLAPLRERIAAQLKRDFDWTPDLFVTCGVSGGLVLAIQACVNPGDEVIFTDPYFVSYPQLVRLAEGVPVPVDTYPDFRLRADRIAAAITPRTKMIILSSPANPTGAVHHVEDVRAVAELARAHELVIVSDEIYCTLSFDGPSPSAARFAPERTVMLRGFGKSYAMTGLRIGFAAGHPEIITEMAKIQQYTFVCAPQPAQFGALASFDVDMSAQVAAYRKKRDLVCTELEGTYDFVRPSGGFYVFPGIPAGYASAAEFCEAALAKNLIIIAGDVFSTRNTHFRISFAVSDDKILAGCRVLRNLAG